MRRETYDGNGVLVGVEELPDPPPRPFDAFALEAVLELVDQLQVEGALTATRATRIKNHLINKRIPVV